MLAKNNFFSGNVCWDARYSLRKREQKIIFGGTIGVGDSYLEFHCVILKFLDYMKYYMKLLEQ